MRYHPIDWVHDLFCLVILRVVTKHAETEIACMQLLELLKLLSIHRLPIFL
jgi:hypothetical protein